MLLIKYLYLHRHLLNHYRLRHQCLLQNLLLEMLDRHRLKFHRHLYHLYSMALKHGTVVLRLRTGNRTDQTGLPSLTPLWRGAEFQEREVYDLYGVVFDGHPDLRRILMWDEFVGFPMRRDYIAPDDFEYEPTPHDEVLVEAKKHYPVEVKTEAKPEVKA